MFEKEKEAFTELNNRLAEEKMELTVICVGGYVLSQYGMRTTQDIDDFYTSNSRLEQIIREVGEEFAINTGSEPWLNNSVQNMNVAPPKQLCKTVYSFSNLHVLIPPLDYIAGMKLSSAREQDVQDVGTIIRKLEIKDPDQLLNTVHGYGFYQIDESVLLEAFGLAYGMEWLEKYYLDHEEELNKRFRESLQDITDQPLD